MSWKNVAPLSVLRKIGAQENFVVTTIVEPRDAMPVMFLDCNADGVSSVQFVPPLVVRRSRPSGPLRPQLLLLPVPATRMLDEVGSMSKALIESDPNASVCG